MRGLIRASNIPALLALFVIVNAWIFVEHQNGKIFEQSLRADVFGRAGLIRAKLEGNVNANIQLVRGLIATLETEPSMDQDRFSELVGNLLQQDSQIRHIAAAPGLVVRLIHPLTGNEQALGLDYNQNEEQRNAALRARDSSELILAGPVELVQGGQGFIGRFPVFTGDKSDDATFWGIVSAVVDVERLYRDSGLLETGSGLDFALKGRDGLGAGGATFFGDATVFTRDPVVVDVILPFGSWQLAAVPQAGWHLQPGNLWQLRGLLLFAAGLIMVPTLLTGRLMEERQSNISDLRQREHELERLSRRLGLALDTSRIGVWEMEVESRDLFWDHRMNELYGFLPDGGARNYEHWASRLHPEDAQRAVEEFRIAVEETGSYLSEYRVILDDCRVRNIRAIGKVYKDSLGGSRILGVNWDVTMDVRLTQELKRANALTEARNAELESAKASIEFNALHDSLTGLPNRRYLDEVLSAHGTRFASTGERAALLQIDLDRFKQINDTLGHLAGDAMLNHAARILQETVEPGDFVARVGGDEFAVVRRWDAGEGEQTTRALARLADRIIADMQRPMNHEGHECRVGVSIGIATDMDFMADPARLLVNADIALYRAKDRGRNRYQFFNDALQAEIVATKRIADDILSGLELGEFVAWYQPQFDCETHEIVGVEALARWNHPAEGLLAPNRFMRIAEELNVVDAIDRTILDQTIADMRRWKETGVYLPKASVNVSARRLQDEELIRSLQQLDMEPGTIAFELVESIFLDDNDELITWNADRIKELGIDVEIDDFGTGHASIVSLMKLKPSRLKIDRQLIAPIVRSAGQRQLVGSIIDIGKSLGIEVLAEGVETMEHAEVLRKLGCNALQGYAFARPMPAGELVEFIRARRWRNAS